ncbi:MAG: hypothetical protein SFU25_06340 [Candidatus Caenarcaniphilales bacterium]|nr:hypothetical protein [Candidatus Caenarcaniphilales bacterium]
MKNWLDFFFIMPPWMIYLSFFIQLVALTYLNSLASSSFYSTNSSSEPTLFFDIFSAIFYLIFFQMALTAGITIHFRGFIPLIKKLTKVEKDKLWKCSLYLQNLLLVSASLIDLLLKYFKPEVVKKFYENGSIFIFF